MLWDPWLVYPLTVAGLIICAVYLGNRGHHGDRDDIRG